MIAAQLVHISSEGDAGAGIAGFIERELFEFKERVEFINRRGERCIGHHQFTSDLRLRKKFAQDEGLKSDVFQIGLPLGGDLAFANVPKEIRLASGETFLCFCTIVRFGFDFDDGEVIAALEQNIRAGKFSAVLKTRLRAE